jgi:hypothetical protein
MLATPITEEQSTVGRRSRGAREDADINFGNTSRTPTLMAARPKVGQSIDCADCLGSGVKGPGTLGRFDVFLSLMIAPSTMSARAIRDEVYGAVTRSL